MLAIEFYYSSFSYAFYNHSHVYIWTHACVYTHAQSFYFQFSKLYNFSYSLILHEKPFISTVQFSHSVMSDSLQPHGLKHARLPCPSPTLRACSNSCPLSRWCHPTISSSVIPFFSCLQSFPASGSFQMSQLFPSGGQSIGVSASASVLPMNTQDWFPLGWTGWPPCSPRDS